MNASTSDGAGDFASHNENETVSHKVEDEELDALLEDALKDFGKPVPPPSTKEKERLSEASGSTKSYLPDEASQLWSEEFIKEATAQFEKKMREYAAGQTQASPTAQNATKSPSVSGDIQKVVEAATKAALSGGDPSMETTLNEAIRGLAVNPDMLNNATGFDDGDLSKLMGTLGMEENFDGKDMDDLLPFMSNMMQKLLSKDLLQPVLGDIVDRYPDWLADNREKLTLVDFEKYNLQYDHMKKICEEYAKEKEDDPEDVKQKRFDYISDLMLKVQSAGPPPKDLIGEGSDAEFLDPSRSSQCSIA